MKSQLLDADKADIVGGIRTRLQVVEDRTDDVDGGAMFRATNGVL